MPSLGEEPTSAPVTAAAPSTPAAAAAKTDFLMLTTPSVVVDGGCSALRKRSVRSRFRTEPDASLGRTRFVLAFALPPRALRSKPMPLRGRDLAHLSDEEL